MANPRKNKDFNPNNCPVTHCLNKFGSKWKPLILYAITKNVNRLSLMQKALPVVSKQMLVNQLRELEADKIVARSTHAGKPRRVEYSITEYGQSLIPIIYVLQEWGIKDMSANNQF